MPDTLVASEEFLTKLVSIAGEHGITAVSGEHLLTGVHDAIGAKWFLGGRKVSYRMSCTLDPASGSVRFREMVKETSWGIPPPRLTVEKTVQTGTKVTTSRTDRGVGGGGHLEYGALRAAVEQAAREAGWQFVFESGKPPVG